MPALIRYLWFNDNNKDWSAVKELSPQCSQCSGKYKCRRITTANAWIQNNKAFLFVCDGCLKTMKSKINNSEIIEILIGDEKYEK